MTNTVIHEVKNRQTRTLIKVVQIDKPKDGYGWSAQCHDHGVQVKVNTRRQAHEAGRTPAAWCNSCAKAIGAPAKKAAPAKRAGAKKVAAPAKRTPAKKAATSRKKAAAK